MRPGWPGRHSEGKHARGTRVFAGRAIWVAAAVAAIVCGAVLVSPPVGTAQLAGAVGSLPLRAPPAPLVLVNGQSFDGTPAVGALFTLAGGRLGRHFCTASVVDSPTRDLVITAAHCVSGKAPGQIAFVPGYHSGQEPYGVWLTSDVLSDTAWRTSADPDHDVAFLVVHQPGSSQRIQDVTGGERLGIGWPERAWVEVIGYPDGTAQPITCQSESKPLNPRQLEFDCGGYTDGTSGGPFIGRVDRSTGAGTVIGVIGGYEQGGDIASVSYSPSFGSAVEALYQLAVAQG